MSHRAVVRLAQLFALKLVAGEGVPYLIDRYRCRSASDGPVELHIRELPLNNSVVIFGEDKRE